MEVLTIMLDLEELKGTISLPAINRGVCHLIFADDVLVFSSGFVSSLKGIEKVFSKFAKLSGLSMNKDESTVFLSESCIQKSRLYPGPSR